MRVDLHIHSSFSDGKYAPREIARQASQNGLDMISLTDHDTLAGVDDLRVAIQENNGLECIAGVELSTSIDEDELHILGYGIDETHIDLRSFISTTQEKRLARVSRILEHLEKKGVNLSMSQVKDTLPAQSLGRVHIACALIKHGYVQTIRGAFERYLTYGIDTLERSVSDFLPPADAIGVILKSGGLPVLAHPSIEIFDRYISQLLDWGIRGVEVFKSSRSSIEEFYLETVAKDKKLLVTGGSDWHGHRPNQRLGDFSVDSARVDRFLRALRNN